MGPYTVRRWADEGVSDPGQGQNIARIVWIWLDLLPQVPDIGPQVRRLVAVLLSPHRLKKSTMR